MVNEILCWPSGFRFSISMKETFTPYFCWDANNQKQFGSLEELEREIDKIEEQSRLDKIPIGVEVSATPDTALMITLGSDASHLEFYGANQSPLLSSSIGPWDDDTLIEGMYLGDVITQMEKRYCVPLHEARAALRMYVTTKVRPSNIRWNN
jgi:hypothetical protein